MARIKNVNVLGGKLFPSILQFTIPLLFVSLIQSLFNAVDIMVLGQMANTDAVAAVGATTSIVHLLTTVSIGISIGAKIVLARLIGEGVREKTEQTVYTTIITAFLLGGITLLVGLIFSPAFLRITNCPAEIFDGALLYMRLYFAAAPAIMIYNFGSNLLQVSGDSQRPLYYMIASGLLNVILNFILCLVMTEKVAAVAIATAVSQLLGAVLVFRRVLVMEGDCRLKLRASNWNWRAFYKIIANGLPIGLSNSLYSLANLQIQSALNSFGSAAIAGNAATVNVEGIIGAIAAGPWGSTVGVFVGQNVGAQKYERVPRIMTTCFCFTLCTASLMSAAVYLFPELVFGLFTDESAVMAIAMEFQPIAVVLFLGSACRSPMNALINGSGNHRVNFATAILDGIVMRIGLSVLLGLVLHMEYLGFWLGDALAGYTPFFIGLVYYFSGAWKTRKYVIKEEK